MKRSTSTARLALEDFTVIADGLAWPESPRWLDGELWFSDVHNHRLMKLTARGDLVKVADVPGRPAGMGFSPEGRLLLATALDRTLWWVEGAQLRAAADLSSATRGLLNDMIVDAQGRAWVGDTGFDLAKGGPEQPGSLLSWRADEGCRVVAPNVRFPNGLALDASGQTLYLAETFGDRVTAFELGRGGALSGRRTHLSLEARPDGLCLDEEGALWIALLWQQELQRIAPDGVVTHRIHFPSERVISCVLGGPDRRTLYVGSAEVDDSDRSQIKRRGRIRQVVVDVAGVGVP